MRDLGLGSRARQGSRKEGLADVRVTRGAEAAQVRGCLGNGQITASHGYPAPTPEATP